MTEEGEYWKFTWDVSGTPQGTHRIKVEACDAFACHNVGYVERDVYVKPVLDIDWIECQNDHDLWLRDPNIPPGPPYNDGDIPLVPPHWKAVTPPITKPFAYTINETMTCNVRVITPDQSVTGEVYTHYVVVNRRSDGFVDIRRIMTKQASLPAEVPHFPPVPPPGAPALPADAGVFFLREEASGQRLGVCWLLHGGASSGVPNVRRPGWPLGPDEQAARTVG